MAAVGPFPPPPPGPPPGYSSSSPYLPYNTAAPSQERQRSRGLSDSYYTHHPHNAYPPQIQQPPIPPHNHSQQQLVVQAKQSHPPQRHHSASPRPISRGQRLGAAAAGAVATTVIDKYLLEGHLGGGHHNHSHHHHHRTSSKEHHTIRRLADVAIGAYAGTEALKQYEKRKSFDDDGGRHHHHKQDENKFYGESHNDLLHPSRGRSRGGGPADQYLSPPASPYHAGYWNQADDAYGRRARSYGPGGNGAGAARGRRYSDNEYDGYDGRRGGDGDGKDRKGSHFKRDLAEAAIAALVGQQAGKAAHHGKDRSPGKHAAEGALVYGVAKELLGRGRRRSGGR